MEELEAAVIGDFVTVEAIKVYYSYALPFSVLNLTLRH